MTNAVTLVIPNPDTIYNLYTDASDIGIGACLSTMSPDGDEKPVIFLSRKLQSAGIRYPTVEKELLADQPSQRLQRWILCTQEYRVKVKQLLSRKNAVADALSRFPTKNQDEDADGEADIEAMFEHMLLEESLGGYEDWLQDLVHYFRNPGNNNTTEKTKRLSIKYYYQDNKPYRQIGARAVFVPQVQEGEAIIKQIHDSHGHFGVHASWARLYHEYWWPRSYTEMKEYVLSCRLCQLYSPVEKNPPTISVPTALKVSPYEYLYVVKGFNLDECSSNLRIKSTMKNILYAALDGLTGESQAPISRALINWFKPHSIIL
ncbi:hypothetical protein [Parasitella parasitica]|uniref:Integrase zinc-binding domain-containing protein n=1 Tax=Parasitella parasitica TaxID=35722 RepID=A0A0B7NMJ2_9FUNG|nr:hypothetical protein [Parasitella parasitica]